ERDRPGRLHKPHERAQERALPGAVRADHRQPLAGLHAAGDAAEHLGAVECDRDAVERDRHPVTPRLVRRTIGKKGARKKEVATRSGSAAGESTVRARMPAKTRKPPPTSRESGSTMR